MASLNEKFSAALTWNAALYVVYKISSTAATYMLYRHLSDADFSAWANIQSFLFLSLLWLDCGFRKSIPRFAPEFACNDLLFRTFIQRVLITQLSILLISFPLFFVLLPRLLLPILRTTTTNPSLIIVAACLFMIEGLVDLFRLIFHAYFLNKHYNLLAISLRLVDIIIISLVMYLKPPSLLTAILYSRLVTSSFIIIGALFLFRALRKTIHTYEQTIPATDLWPRFTQHSAIMWFNNFIKSLTERNFLILLLTRTFGPAQANIFKIAQDSALLFERSVFKTIGIADTALLSHAQGATEKLQLFKSLQQKIFILCAGALGIATIMAIYNSHLFVGQVLYLFLIFMVSYVIEVFFSPYERLLEVNRHYILLWLAYLPYLIAIILLFTLMPVHSLITFILLIQCSRLVSSTLMLLFAYRHYNLAMPWIAYKKQ